ncbi:5058_t:CDS:2, partial [Paraglomus brasilianum]
TNSDDTPKQIISQNENISKSDISDNASNSDVCQESSPQPEAGSRQYTTSPICTETKSSDDKEMDNFHYSIYKERGEEITRSKIDTKIPSSENPTTEISPDIAFTLSHDQKNIQSESAGPARPKTSAKLEPTPIN